MDKPRQIKFYSTLREAAPNVSKMSLAALVFKLLWQNGLGLEALVSVAVENGDFSKLLHWKVYRSL